MVFRLRVVPDEVWRHNPNTLWSKYRHAIKNKYPELYSSNAHIVFTKLADYNASDVKGELFLEFDTEEDAIAFTLMFG